MLCFEFEGILEEEVISFSNVKNGEQVIFRLRLSDVIVGIYKL